MAETKFERSTGMTPHRLESLADGIFAFAMTLLVLSINLPQGGAPGNVSAYLFTQYGNFWNFALSFILLAIFWLGHSQQYHHIKSTDGISLWINVAALMFVVLIPFSASLGNDYPDDLVAEIFFNANMLVLSALLALNWWYAYRRGFIDSQGNEQHIARLNRRVLIVPGVALLSILVALVWPGWSTLTYFLIPLLAYFPAGKKNEG